MQVPLRDQGKSQILRIRGEVPACSRVDRRWVVFEILVAVAGITPQVITETLYYLTQECDPPVALTEIYVLTTQPGRQRVLTELSHPECWSLLCLLSMSTTSIPRVLPSIPSRPCVCRCGRRTPGRYSHRRRQHCGSRPDFGGDPPPDG